MDSIAVTKQDMTLARQDSLSPFGLLTQLFTAELVRRNGQAIGSYRPMRLAYLEEEENAAAAPPPEIHFDLNVDLIVNRLLKEAQAQEKEKSEKAKTPAERILERVILREREIRTAYQDTRRVVIESGGHRTTANLPADKAAQTSASTKQTAQTVRVRVQETRQAGEGRSAAKTDAPRRSADLTRPAPVVMTSAPSEQRRLPRRELTLASQAMSAPAAGGWTPREREVHPGFPPRAAKPQDSFAAGSILLPDVLRRRREAAMERRESPENRPAAQDADALSEDILAWATEGTEQTTETERVVRAVRRAVQETLRRNELRASRPPQTARTEPAERPTEQLASPTYRQTAQAQTEAQTFAQGAASAAPAHSEKPDAAAPEAAPRAPAAVPETPRQKAAQAAPTAEPEAGADRPAELVFRTQTEETAAPTAVLPREQIERGRAPVETAQTPDTGTEAQTAHSAVRLAQAGTEAHLTHPTAPSEKTGGTRDGISAEEIAAIRPEGPEAPGPQTAMPAAEPAAGSAEPAALIFRTQTEEPAAQTPGESVSPSQKRYDSTQAPRETARTPDSMTEAQAPRGAAQQARTETEARPAAPSEKAGGTRYAASREGAPAIRPEAQTAPAPQTAMPAAEPETAAPGPAELIYRTQTEETAGEPAVTPQEKTDFSQDNTVIRTAAPAASAPRAEIPAEGSEAAAIGPAALTIRTQADAFTPQSAAEAAAYPKEEQRLPRETALPVAAEADASEPTELVFRAEKAEPAPQARPAAEAAAFPQEQYEGQRTPRETALPAAAEADASEPTELVFRAEKAEPAPQARPAAEAAAFPQEQYEGQRTPRETALPAAAEADAAGPAELIHRTEAAASAAEAAAFQQTQQRQSDRHETPGALTPPAEPAKGQANASAASGQPAPAAVPSAKTGGTPSGAPEEGKSAVQAAAAASEPAEPASAAPTFAEAASEALPSEDATPAEPAPRTAIPTAEPETAASVPPELIYRAEAPEPAAEAAAFQQTQQRQSDRHETPGALTPPAEPAGGQANASSASGQPARPAAPSAKTGGTRDGAPEEGKSAAQAAPMPAEPASAESAHEGPASDEPATAEPAPRTAVPTAEPEAAASAPPELIYRTEAPEPTAQTAAFHQAQQRQSEGHKTSGEMTPPAAAETRGQANASAASGQPARPGSPSAKTERTQDTAPEVGGSTVQAAPTAYAPAKPLPADSVREEPAYEALMPEASAPPTAIPAAEPETAAPEPAELIYRAEQADSAPRTAPKAEAFAQERSEQRQTPHAAAQPGTQPRPEHAASRSAQPAGTQDAAPANENPPDRTETPGGTALQTAIPAAEPEADTPGPAALIYRAEQADHPPQTAGEAEAFARERAEKPQTPRPQAQPRTEAQPAQTGAQPQPAHTGAPSEKTEGTRASAAAAKAAATEEDTDYPVQAAEPAPLTAIPAAETEAGAPGAAELIYRADGSAEAPETGTPETAKTKASGHAEAPQRGAAAPQAETKTGTAGTPRGAALPETAQTTYPVTSPAAPTPRDGLPAPEDLPAEEAAPAAAAIPAAEAEAEIPAELVYRSLTGTPLRQGEVRPENAAQPGRSVRPEPGAAQVQRPTAIAARDIRLTAPTRRGQARRGTGEEAPAYATPDAQRAEGGTAEADEPQTPATAVPASEEADSAAPPEMFYAAPPYSAEQQPDAPAAARPTERAPQQRMKGEMPAWAKELLEKAGVKDTVEQVPILPGQNWATSGKQITWTAPGVSSPIQSVQMNNAAELTYKERAQTEEDAAKPSVSEAEIQRTADRVYRIIEERLRRELRRSGR